MVGESNIRVTMKPSALCHVIGVVVASRERSDQKRMHELCYTKLDNSSTRRKIKQVAAALRTNSSSRLAAHCLR